MPPRRVILFSSLPCLLLLALAGLKNGDVRAAGIEPVLLSTVTARYEPLAWMHGGERFPSGARIFVRDSAKGQVPLIPDFAQTADPALSFDGQRVLFAGKAKAEDPWQIWEMSFSDGKPPHHVTSGNEDCIRPFYLPDNRIVYARKVVGRFVIEALDQAGGKPLALTYGPANFLPTDILRDGRILFEAGYPLGSETTPEIYTVYSDGSGVESYRCDHGNARSEGREINSGDIVFASRAGLGRFTSARAQQLPIAAPAGEYAGDVAETPTGDWFVSWRPSANAHFQLMQWTQGTAHLQPVVTEADSDVVQPVLADERSLPKKHPSGLHDWEGGNLLCLNAYTSKYAFAAGSIRSARFYTRDEAGHPQLLGAAPVERDGSFFAHIPSDKPLQIELLDASGKTLKRESGFFWIRRGEQRVCVGCHAGPETSPENAVPMILLKSTTPADLTGGDAPRAAGGH